VPLTAAIQGAQSKELLTRPEDVQVLNGFATVADAHAYLKSDLFTRDVVKELTPYLDGDPEVRIYEVV
jgi:hypothetical protein